MQQRKQLGAFGCAGVIECLHRRVQELVGKPAGKLLEYLHGLGIRPGAQLKVVGKNYDQTMTLRVDRKPVQLGGAAAAKVWVTAN